MMLEFNCYEHARREADTPASLWLIPYSLAEDKHDFDHHKPAATRIVGPAGTRIVEQVGVSLSAALRGLGFTVEQETTADD